MAEPTKSELQNLTSRMSELAEKLRQRTTADERLTLLREFRLLLRLADERVKDLDDPQVI